MSPYLLGMTYCGFCGEWRKKEDRCHVCHNQTRRGPVDKTRTRI